MPTLATYIQGSIRSLSHSNQTENEIKGIQTLNVVIKLSLFADDMILYIENHKDAARTLQEIINEFGQVAGYEINIKKWVAY